METHLNEKEAYAFLESLFPAGLKDADLISELCPEGWEHSPLFACYHPPPEIMYQAHIRVSRNLKRLFSTKMRMADQDLPEPQDEPEPTFEEFMAKHPPEKKPLTPKARIHEPTELLGLCLWDLFSDNHDVIAADGRIVHLGSFRGSAGMISDFFESSSREKSQKCDGWDHRGGGYLDFYMGTSWISGRTDLTPAYKLIFRRLRAAGADWRYSFPRIHLIDFGPQPAAPDAPYDPSAALQREAEEKARAAETTKMRRALDRDVQAAKRHARSGPPPATVRAYQNIFHRFPQGWPPDPYTP